MDAVAVSAVLCDVLPYGHVTIEKNRSSNQRAASFASNPAKIGRPPPEQALLKCSSFTHPAAREFNSQLNFAG